MTASRARSVLLALTLAASLGALTGCTPPAPVPSQTTAAPSDSATPTATPSPSETQTASPPYSTDDPCLRDSLDMTYAATGNSAGHAHGILTFTNISSAACNLQGYPTVWFDNPEAQQPMGAPATVDPISGLVPDFDLEPGASATATVTITQAGFVDGCTLVTANAFLVIPPLPGPPPTDWSSYVRHLPIDPTPACSNDTIALIAVGPMSPA